MCYKISKAGSWFACQCGKGCYRLSVTGAKTHAFIINELSNKNIAKMSENVTEFMVSCFRKHFRIKQTPHCLFRRTL